jgi:hypothetical protein
MCRHRRRRSPAPKKMTCMEFMDLLMNADFAKPLAPQLGGDPTVETNLFLLLEQGNLLQQYVYGGDDAPLPVDADPDNSFDEEAWKKTHPASHIGENFLQPQPGFVSTRFPAFKPAG